MAKIGQGDARWIVEDRADGTNVNNWHWTEKDITNWTKEQLETTISCLESREGAYAVKFTGLDRFEGDVILNNRKRKLIPTYELNFSFKWTAENTSSGVSTSGTLQVPYLSEENHDEDPELRVSTSSAGSAAEEARQAVISVAKSEVLPRVKTLVEKIHAGGPSTSSEPQSVKNTATNGVAKEALKGVPQSDAQPAKPKNTSSRVRSELHQTHKFYASPHDLYECFTVAQRMMAYTQSPATTEPRVGGPFSMFNGSLTGEYTTLERDSRVEMKWRFSSWEDGVYSKVCLSFTSPDAGSTVVTLDHTAIPEEDRFGNENVLPNVERGWEEQIFRRIKAVFGYGI